MKLPPPALDRLGIALALCVYLLLPACRTAETPPPASAETVATWAAPEDRYPELLDAVQMARLFPDGKTFVDMRPKADYTVIREAYQREKSKPDFQLRAFVDRYFDAPINPTNAFQTDENKDAAAHINSLWPVLTRPADDPQTRGTLIPLPNPYVVPGGRFREVYYWDSYFTMLGLIEADRTDLVTHMLDNFAYLIDTIGFVPNGNRTYYLGRSQPPFFAAMVALLADENGTEVLRHYLPALQGEYDFWMSGADRLTAAAPAHRRVVRMPGGEVLNRYYDDRPGPRPESYREDVEAARASGRDSATVYTHLRAGAESGWDYSSRWFTDPQDISTIRTTDIVPVDLNSLLYNLERVLSKAYRADAQPQAAREMEQAAARRRAAINRYHWDTNAGFYLDYDWVAQRPTGVKSLAGVYPLYFRLAAPEQADAMAALIETEFLRPGGVVSTLTRTGQQWDAPNGWAPLQWLTYGGLLNYGHQELAEEIKARWTALNERVYRNTGRMMEKYNVEDLSLDAGGGEYPVQDGFGWTNGVLLYFLGDNDDHLGFDPAGRY